MSIPEVGDTVQFWRRDKGATRSENVVAEVLEVIGEWVYVRRLDTGEERPVAAARLRVVGLARTQE